MTDADVASQLALVFLLAAVIYILPSVVAFSRRHPNRYAILAVNLVLGGTGIGWLGALIWAMDLVHLPREPSVSAGLESEPNLLVNDGGHVRRVAPPNSVSREGLAPGASFSTAAAVAELERLTRLKIAGHLSEAEFAVLKHAILERHQSAQRC